jgi:hypothetical protein
MTLAKLSADDVTVTPSEAPNTTPLPYNPPTPSNPLLQQPTGNSTATFNGSQSAELLTPNLYTTGVNNLSQVATNAALSHAFNQELTTGPSSESLLDVPHGPIERILLGPLTLKAVLSTNVVTDDNIRGQPAGPKRLSDTSFAITPAVMVQYGAQPGQKASATLIYSPTITRFLRHSNENTDNQNVSLAAQYPFQKLVLQFAQNYSQNTGINPDLNSRTQQTNSVTTFGATYEIDDKLSFAGHVNEVITSYAQGGGIGEDSSIIDTALAYRLTEKITLGPGLNLGLDSPQGGPRQTYEQALLRLSYDPTERISFFTQGGLEFRQYNHGGEKENPIFSVGLGYTPFDSTSLAVNGFESVRSSNAVSSQSVVAMGFGFTASQRILHRFYLGFGFTYEHEDYQTGSSGAPATTSVVGSSVDNLLYRPSLTFNPTSWTSVAIYYQYSENLTNSAASTYHDNQAGVSVTAQF